MGQFKPMVKMYTDEPSVILKLKKGGKVHHKAHHKSQEEHGHVSMHHAHGGHMHGAHAAFEAEHGSAPKKPSMAERQKAMNPNQYKKGGKVHHKFDGGAMPGAAAPAVAPAAAPAQTAMGLAALRNMAPAARMARAAAVRRALMGMKKGGHAGLESHVAKLEKELKHHEHLSSKKAHHKASGGEIDRAETKTTIEGGVKKFAKTKVDDGQKKDRAHGTGEVKEGKPGGFKHGGHAKKHHKAFGGTIEGNEGKFENTFVVDGDHADKAHGTGEVKESNAGGFKKGGHHKIHHKATGGAIPAATEKDKKEGHLKLDAYEGGNWENRPADTSTPGIKGARTGEVKESNAGGFKKGGKAKKAYATGGNVVDDGKAQKMPRHFKSLPVANSLQSGTFKKGGKVKKFSDGDSVDGAEYRGYQQSREQERLDNEADRKMMEELPSRLVELPGRLYRKAKDFFSSSATPPAGSVTRTEKSTTVSPPTVAGRKHGGKC